MPETSPFLAGAVGALLHEATRWVGFRTAGKLPAYLTKVHYWLLTLVLVGMGGLLAAYLAPDTGTQALYIGISAPAIISRIGQIVPEQIKLGDRSAGEPEETGLRDWLRG